MKVPKVWNTTQSGPRPNRGAVVNRKPLLKHLIVQNWKLITVYLYFLYLTLCRPITNLAYTSIDYTRPAA